MTDGNEIARAADVIDALLRDDAIISELRATNDATERYVEGWLVPTVSRRRAECLNLRRKLEALRGTRTCQPEEDPRLACVEFELAAARAEVDALRRSLSWRVTAPLRRVYGLLFLRGRR